MVSHLVAYDADRQYAAVAECCLNPVEGYIIFVEGYSVLVEGYSVKQKSYVNVCGIKEKTLSLQKPIIQVMKQRRTSLKDLAEQLGVSIATVSRALRDSHEVGEEMKKKVQELAKRLNYRPNPFAQSLRKEAPRVIGVVVPNLVTHYYASVLDGIEDYASKAGYSVISANSHEDHTREEKAVDNFINMHVEGIIACLAQDTVDYSHFEQINKMGIPLVFFARTCLPELFSSVVADGDVAAQQATNHLIETGSKRIAFLGGPNHLDMVRRRKHGYLEALREHRIPIDRTLVVCGKIDCWTVRTVPMPFWPSTILLPMPPSMPSRARGCAFRRMWPSLALPMATRLPS